MAWIILVGAGLLEIAMATALKESHGFSRLGPSIAFVMTAVLSFGMLSLALKTLPVGTAYAVWTGIGATGTAIIGMLFLGDPRDAARLISIALIIAGVIGLRLAGA